MKKNKETLDIVVLSTACCAPSMMAFDEQASKVVDKAIKETGIQASVSVVPGSKAYFDASYRKIINELIAMQGKGKTVAPAILINKEIISYGVPNLDDMKAALIKFVENKSKE